MQHVHGHRAWVLANRHVVGIAAKLVVLVSRTFDPMSDRLFHMTAQTMFGMEHLLVAELEKIGAQDIEKHNRAVAFRGDEACMYRANLNLRTALRILVPIKSFQVEHEEDLYYGIKRIRWEQFMDVDDTLSVHCTLHSERFNHSQFLALKAKDAIVDRFREHYGRRPNVELEDPTLRIHLHVHGDDCLVSLDSSGGSLHKRGYRDHTNLAPINEVLAAGLVLLTGWDGRSNFVDPMCGSGTILIEAAMIAGNIAPGIHRQQFGFQRWKDYDPQLWKEVRDEAVARIEHDARPVILGGELSPHVARKAESNIASAGYKDRIRIVNKPFQELEPPEGGGVMILNPPYGERMDKDEDINAVYKMIGDTLKQRWAGWTAWMITSNMEAAKQVRLTPKPKIKVFNGSLDCRFMRYELYSGTRRKFEEEAT
jgi:putative N6-adenine-specific DNA methylase